MKMYDFKKSVITLSVLTLLSFVLIGGCNNDGGGAVDPIISSTIPDEVEAHKGRSTPNNDDYNFFAWQTFVALNWPSLPNGQPAQVPIGTNPNAFRVWEHFDEGWRPFEESGASGASGDTDPVRTFVSDDSLQASSQAPMIDKFKNYFLYTVNIDDTLVDYIDSNGLNSIDGIEEFGENVSQFMFFPPGSIELKLSWRIFPDGTDQATLDRYYVRDAEVTVADTDSETGEEFTIENIKVGLVGMHITHKTPDNPAWVWSTFEHVDLTDPSEPVILLGEEGDLDNNRAPNEISTGEAPKDSTGAPDYEYKWVDPTTGDAMASLYESTVASRATNELNLPNSMNRRWQEDLPEPWSNYQLVITQRLNQAGDNANPISKQKGVSIARNIGSETYIIADFDQFTDQSQVPPVDPLDSCELNPDSSQSIAVQLVESEFNWPDNPEDFTTDSWSSCMQCHGFFAFQYGTGTTDQVWTDYSYLFFSNLSQDQCDTSDSEE